MKKLLVAAAFIALTGCVEEGPPNYNERDRRAYNSLLETDDNCGHTDAYGHYYRDCSDHTVVVTHPVAAAPGDTVIVEHHTVVDPLYYHDGYYDRYGNWHEYTATGDVVNDGYNPTNGHDHWARQSN